MRVSTILVNIEGSVEETTLTYIIRDHDRDRFERRKKELEHLTRKTNHEFPGCATIEIKDQYFNMREKIEPVMHIIDVAEEAMKLAGVKRKSSLSVGVQTVRSFRLKVFLVPISSQVGLISTGVMSLCRCSRWKRLSVLLLRLSVL